MSTRWHNPALIQGLIICVLPLCCLCIPGAENAARAQVFPAVRGMDESVPTSITKVRHHRRHRRSRSELEEEREEKSYKGSAGKPEVQVPPPAPDKAPKQTEQGKQEPPPTKDKDQTATKPPEPQGPPPPPDVWSAAEVEAGSRDCDRRLSGAHILFDRLDPIREGACGTPAPIRLKGFEIDRAPNLDFVPAPTMTCKLAEAMRRWFDDVVQPKAKAHLNATIVHMTNLSAYNCRSRYDDATQRLSQHAYANAIDVSEFITAKGEHIDVLDNWESGDERAAFLREIHDGACEIFGTTLGPEANAAHKNHFHLDMTERRRPLCDFTPAQVRAREEAKKHAAVPPSAAVKVPVGGSDRQATAKAPEKPESKVEATPAVAESAPKATSEETAPEEQKHRRRRRRSHHVRLF
jgi:hypothetical protein